MTLCDTREVLTVAPSLFFATMPDSFNLERLVAYFW